MQVKRGKTQDELDWIRLLIAVGGFGPQIVHSLVEHFGQVGDIVSASRQAVQRVAGPECARALVSDQTQETFEATLRWLDNTPEGDVVTWSDADYPVELLHAGLAPALLWVRGQRSLLERTRIFVTGTDRPDAEGRRNARDFASALVARRAAVVCGLNEGIETYAAQGAMQAEGALIVVQATGPNRLWPQANRALFMQAAQQGLLMSPFAPDVSVDDATRDQQMQLCTAMSQSLLVVQAELGARALVAARLAAEMGRDVKVIPGSIHSPLYKGSLRLLRQGAAVTETVSDVLEK